MVGRKWKREPQSEKEKTTYMRLYRIQFQSLLVFPFRPGLAVTNWFGLRVFDCLRVCVLACMRACVYACLLTCVCLLSVYVGTYLPVCFGACVPVIIYVRDVEYVLV